MNAIRRWYELLLTSVVMLFVLSTGTVKTANAQYAYVQGNWEKYEYASDPIWDPTSSHQEWALASATADGE